MEFGPNDTQRLFDRIVRDFLADHVPMDTLHRLAASGAGFDDKLWAGLTELGLPGVLVPERFGGAGLGTFEAGLAAEALGAYAAPLPFAGAAVMAPLALLRAGSDTAREAWLPRIADGTARIAVAFATLDGAPALERRGDRLSGRASGLIDPGGATHVLLVLAGGTLALAAADGPGVAVTSTGTAGGPIVVAFAPPLGAPWPTAVTATTT
jgi:alkylation response protein AidB-like acyl-CoA dehydrogenase